MFTGIVEEVGVVSGMTELGNGRTVRIRCALVREGMTLGDSVAVDGACLTATELHPDGFSVQSIATTLARTLIGEYVVGRRVNLERALAFGGRLGGHLVQGHVDGLGEVLSVESREELVLIDFTMPEEVTPVAVLHGSIAVNGISLTVNALPAPGVCQISVIPFTLAHTSLGDIRAGDLVHVEGDLIGKYVRHLLGAPAAAGSPHDPADLRRGWGYQ